MTSPMGMTGDSTERVTKNQAIPRATSRTDGSSGGLAPPGPIEEGPLHEHERHGQREGDLLGPEGEHRGDEEACMERDAPPPGRAQPAGQVEHDGEEVEEGRERGDAPRRALPRRTRRPPPTERSPTPAAGETGTPGPPASGRA